MDSVLLESVLNSSADSWLEEEAVNGLKIWQLIALCFGCFLCVVIMLCCCFRFRIPRTKQDIEADYQRRKIAKKFRERLTHIQNAEMDEMDLQKALDRVRKDVMAVKEAEEKLQELVIANMKPSKNGGNIV